MKAAGWEIVEMMKIRRKRGVGEATAQLASISGPHKGDGALLAVACAGEWLPSEELRDQALAALAASDRVTLDLGGVDHLDASALQILLALSVAQRRRGRQLQVLNLSASLRQWLECAGAADHFASIGSSSPVAAGRA
jgi:anti-anti-sigma factor